MTITAVIITRDEERNIDRCLQSLEGVADEVIVVDSGSTDRTEQICQGHGVRFVRHEWEGYAAQKNYANGLATCQWILSIDADEALSPQLRNSILALKRQETQAPGPSVSRTVRVYAFNRLTNYCGHWVRHCGWYPDRCTRLFPAGTACWDGLIHEQLNFNAPATTSHLDGDLHHYSYYTVAEHLSRMVKYAPLSAEKAYQEGKRCGALAVVLRPAWTFVRGYILKGGFLDGTTGFVICRLSATYTLVKYATLRHLCQ